MAEPQEGLVEPQWGSWYLLGTLSVWGKLELKLGPAWGKPLETGGSDGHGPADSTSN